MITHLTSTLPTWFKASSIVHLGQRSSHQVVLKAFTISESHYWNFKKNFIMLFIWCQQNSKFLSHASDILKCWIVSDVKSEFTFRGSSILSFKKAISRLTSCFEYLRSHHPFSIASFNQPFLLVVAALVRLFIIRTNPVESQSLAGGYTFLLW